MKYVALKYTAPCIVYRKTDLSTIDLKVMQLFENSKHGKPAVFILLLILLLDDLNIQYFHCHYYHYNIVKCSAIFVISSLNNFSIVVSTWYNLCNFRRNFLDLPF